MGNVVRKYINPPSSGRTTPACVTKGTSESSRGIHPHLSRQEPAYKQTFYWLFSLPHVTYLISSAVFPEISSQINYSQQGLIWEGGRGMWTKRESQHFTIMSLFASVYNAGSSAKSFTEPGNLDYQALTLILYLCTSTSPGIEPCPH